MKPSLRTVLAESHIGAIAIAILLYWSVYAGLQFVSYPLYNIFAWVLTGVLVLDIPYIPDRLSIYDQFLLMMCIWNFVSAVTFFVVASRLSHWLFGTDAVTTLRSRRFVPWRRPNV